MLSALALSIVPTWGLAAAAAVQQPPPREAQTGGLAARYWSAPHEEPGLSVGELLRRPLVVNGATVPQAELERFLIFGPGQTMIEAKKFEAIMTNEVVSRGETMEAYWVSDEDVENEVARQRKDFEVSYPTLDFKTEVRRAFRDFELWRTHLRQTMTFDRIFLPDDPDQWPPVTTAAVIDESGGSTMFVEDAKDVYIERIKYMQDGGLDDLPAYPMMYLEILRSMVLDSLHKFSAIETFPERLPEGAVMQVDSHVIDRAEVFAWLEPYLTWKDVQDARYWMAKVTVLEQDLAKSEHLLDRASFAQKWAQQAVEQQFQNARQIKERELPDEDPEVRAAKLAEWEASYDTTPQGYQRMLFDRQMLGLQSDRFPSMWAWGEHQRLMMSYGQRIADELTDTEKLRTILPYTNQITGLAKCDSQMILCSAFDFDTFEWIEDGWQQAFERAQRVQALLADGADWNETLDAESDFWDPPQPEVGPQKPMFGFKFKGQWGEEIRNNILTKTEESNYTTFLYGDPLADYAFFEQPPGVVGGPFRGPYGYYLTRVFGRTPYVRPLDLTEPRHFDLAREYYLRDAFTRKSRELMLAADIQGLYGPAE